MFCRSSAAWLLPERKEAWDCPAGSRLCYTQSGEETSHPRPSGLLFKGCQRHFTFWENKKGKHRLLVSAALTTLLKHHICVSDAESKSSWATSMIQIP